MRVELELAGDVQVRRELLRFANAATDASPAFAQIMLDLARLEREQFDTEGARASGGWAELAASTVARKQAQGLDERILRATGELYESLTGLVSGSHAIREAHPDWMRFGTDVPYARYHQTGTDRMPRRRPIETTETDRHQMMVLTLQRYLVTGRL